MPAYRSREELDRVLAHLAELMARDAALIRASRGRDFTFCITFRDLSTAFHGVLRDGLVRGGLGRPSGPSTIEVGVDSQVFDGIFGGRMNPILAVLRGDLSFSGDTASGLRFQGLVPDFGRLYRQARRAEGAQR